MMKAEIDIVKDYRGTGMEVVRISLCPESGTEKFIASCVGVGVPPEGNIVGWLADTKIILEAKDNGNSA